MDNTQKELKFVEKNEKKIQKQETNNKILSGDSTTWFKETLIDIAVPVAASTYAVTLGLPTFSTLAVTIGLTAAGSTIANYFIKGDDLSTAIKKGIISAGFVGAGYGVSNFFEKTFGKFANIFKPGSYTGDASKTIMPNSEKTLTLPQQAGIYGKIQSMVLPQNNKLEATKNSPSQYENQITLFEKYVSKNEKNGENLINLLNEQKIKNEDLYQLLKEKTNEIGITIPDTLEDYHKNGSKELTGLIIKTNSQINSQYTGTSEQMKNQISESRRPEIEKIEGETEELQKQNQSLKKQNQDIESQETQMKKETPAYNQWLVDEGITADEFKESLKKSNRLVAEPKETNEIFQKIVNDFAPSLIEEAKLALFGGEKPKIPFAKLDQIAAGNSPLTKDSILNPAFQEVAHNILQEKLPEEHKTAYEYIFKQRKPNQEIVSENQKTIANNEETIANNKNKIQNLSEITDKDLKNTLALEKEFFNVNPETQKEKQDLEYNRELLNNFFRNEEEVKDLKLKIYEHNNKKKSEEKKLAELRDKQTKETTEKNIKTAEIEDKNAQTELNNEVNEERNKRLNELLTGSKANEETNREKVKDAEEEAKAKEKSNALIDALIKGVAGGIPATLLNNFLFPKKQEQK